MRATVALRLMILSAGLIGGLKAVSLVAALPPMGAPVAAASASQPAPPAAAPAAAVPPAPRAEPGPDPQEAVAAALRARREALEERERVLAAREALLSATERRLSQRVEELSEIQRRAEHAEAEARTREDAHWRGLARLYEAMRPREAAAVFNDLDMPVLVQIVDRMGERKAAPVMAAMAPERARLLTLELSRARTTRAAATN
jgi:flagellar motility protein MotE (MotC chaperone)